MKPSLEEMPENSLDLLLFQYVEGELDAEQARQLERQIADDDTLREELNLWRESFVQADFDDTSALEKTLLAAQKPYWLRFSSSNCVLLLLLVATLFRPASAIKKVPVRFADLPTKASAKVEPENTLTLATNETKAKKTNAESGQLMRQTKAPVLAEPEFSETQEVARLQNETIALPLLKPRLTLEAESVAIRLADLSGRVAVLKRTESAAPKKLTRQQRRQIIRLKEKALQERKANEFLKGNIPYVVPLNTNNF